MLGKTFISGRDLVRRVKVIRHTLAKIGSLQSCWGIWVRGAMHDDDQEAKVEN